MKAVISTEILGGGGASVDARLYAPLSDPRLYAMRLGSFRDNACNEAPIVEAAQCSIVSCEYVPREYRAR
jgi:hypothetical protein